VLLKGTAVRLFILPIVLIVALVLGVVPAVLADPITIFSTGVDDSGGLLAGGSVDPHYRLITSADLRAPGPEAFVVNASGYPIPSRWFVNNSSSQWIAPRLISQAPGEIPQL
jgi:hypothetical protein